jgi:hypothetical protein
MSETNEGISCPKDNSKEKQKIKEQKRIMDRRPKKIPLLKEG